MDKVEGSGTAAIFRGDPRRTGEKNDLESWLASALEGGERGEISARPHLYGSDAGFCSRRNVLLAHNTWLANTVNSAGRGYMAIGNAFEELLIQALKRNRSLIAAQFKGPQLPGLKISSRYDAIIFDPEGEIALLEIKTCGRLPDEEKPTHLAQVQTYAAVSGIRRAHLVYLSRELSPRRPIALRTFAIDTSDEALRGRLKIAHESGLAAEAAALPPRPAHFRKHTECHYCEFRDHFCWADRVGRGATEPEPPLRELSTEEYIRLSERAARLAQEDMSEADERYAQTLDELVKLKSPFMFPKQVKMLREAAAGAG